MEKIINNSWEVTKINVGCPILRDKNPATIEPSQIPIKMTMSSKLWLSEGFGMVKQENYNKKGALIGKSVLTSFEE
jgi:hypothetical protein